MLITFINSLGCSVNGPILNQLLDPFLSVPIPGTNTKINKLVEVYNSNKNIMGEFHA